MYGNPFINNATPDFYRLQTHQPPVYTGYSTPYPAPQLFQMPQPQPNFTIKRVSSIEEAKAAMIDPLGTYFFVDTGAGKIYMKQIKNDGTAEFYTFGVENASEDSSKENENSLIEINKRLSNIETVLGGIANVQPVSGDTSGKQSETVPQSAVTEPNEPDGTAESTSLSNVAANDFWKKRR